MIRSVYLPNYMEDAVYNTKNIDDDGAVYAQGFRSGSIYILWFDDSGRLTDYDIV